MTNSILFETLNHKKGISHGDLQYYMYALCAAEVVMIGNVLVHGTLLTGSIKSTLQQLEVLSTTWSGACMQSDTKHCPISYS